MAVTKYHEFEIYSQDRDGRTVEVTLEVGASITVDDTEVCVEDIDEISLQIWTEPDKKINLNFDLDIDRFSRPLIQWMTRELKGVYADDWQEIAAEEREGLASQQADSELAYQKEHREAS